MIKKNSANTRQQLLRKNSDESIQQYPPFEVEDCYSVVDFDDKDHSYCCLGPEQASNPYFIELTERQPDIRPINKNTQKCMPEKITMNGNYYQKIDCGQKNQINDEIKALCGACNAIQLIPKKSTKFYCYACRTLCKCGEIKSKEKQQIEQPKKSPETRPASPSQANSSPKTKLFVCGCCSIKVKYEAGISQYIRCSRCNTVNMVPK